MPSIYLGGTFGEQRFQIRLSAKGPSLAQVGDSEVYAVLRVTNCISLTTQMSGNSART